MKRRTVRWFASLVAAALLGGCALSSGPPPLAASGDAHGHHRRFGGLQNAREERLRAQWRNQTYADLVKALGAPRREMPIPGRDPNVTFAVYYGMLDTEAGCFDAFTIVDVAGDAIVVDYFCR